MIRADDVVRVPTKAGVPARALVLRVYVHAGEYLADIARESDSVVGTCKLRLLQPCCNATGCLAGLEGGWVPGLCAHHSMEDDLLGQDVSHFVALEERGETPEAYEARVSGREKKR